MTWREFLGPELDWITICGWKATDATEACRNAVKWHLWLAEDQGHISSCDEHVAVARDILRVEDEHLWGQWCNLPGSIWVREDSLSWCELEDGDPLARLANDMELAAAVGVGA